jgi:hypothetical protein
MALATEFTPIASTLGGMILGLASALMLAGNGRIAGISGIIGGFFEGGEGRHWRGTFLLGMLIGGLALRAVLPSALTVSAVQSVPMLIAAGLLVGFGTRLGGGCTSGHGICGISRLSTRSIVATVTFMGAAMITVALVRHVFGGAA